MADKILARAIVEVVGKPKEYVEKTIQTVIDTATEIKGLTSPGILPVLLCIHKWVIAILVKILIYV